MRGRLPVTGTYTGSGSAPGTFYTGFRPRKVEVYNVTLGTVKYEAVSLGSETADASGFADGGGFKYKSGSSEPATATNAITFGPTGFSLGSDSDICVNTDVYVWIAF